MKKDFEFSEVFINIMSDIKMKHKIVYQIISVYYVVYVRIYA